MIKTRTLLRATGMLTASVLLFAIVSCGSPSAEKKEKEEGNKTADSSAVKSTEPASAPQGMKTEKSSKGFSIAVPGEWEAQHDLEGTDLMVFSPVSGEADNFRENYSIIIANAQGYELDKFYSENVRVFGISAPMYKKINEGDDTVAGTPAKWLEYQFTSQGVTVHGRQYYLVKNNRAAVITFSASPEGFNDYINTFNTVLKTFTLD